MKSLSVLAMFFFVATLPKAAVPQAVLAETAAESVTREDAEASLRAADESFQTYAQTRDRIGFRSLLATDVLYFGEELHRGFGPVLRAWDPQWNEKDGFSYQGEVLEATVAKSGDLGFTLGRVETRYRPPVDTEDRVHGGHYLTVWNQGPRGWQVVASGPLLVHATLGESRDPRGALIASWPELSERIDADLDLRWQARTTTYAESGELAWVFGTYEATFGPADAKSSAEADSASSSGHETGGSGHFLAVWQKDGEGRWQLAAEAMTAPR